MRGDRTILQTKLEDEQRISKSGCDGMNLKVGERTEASIKTHVLTNNKWVPEIQSPSLIQEKKVLNFPTNQNLGKS